MKILSLLLAVVLIQQTALGERTPITASDWRAKVKVVKVFFATEGDATFRAYLVRWKNQEVVAQDILATSTYHVGDTITVLVIKVISSPKGRKPYKVLSFHVMPKV